MQQETQTDTNPSTLSNPNTDNNQRCKRLKQERANKYPTGSKILVTCGLPYANGPMHIAHLRTYVPGDVFVRYLRKLGQDTLFVCGSDTHGTPITVKAEELGLTPAQVAEKYHQHYKDIFPRLGIHFDNYGSTDHPLNHHRTREIAEKLAENGYIYPKEVTQPYCPTCSRFLPDRYMVGTCPYCGAEARGDECDQGCRRYLEPGELQEPRCIICGTRAEQRRTRHYFLKLTAFKDFLRSFLESLEGTENARNYAKQWLEQGLKDWNITRNIGWGVKYPGEDNLVLYVWFDAPIGYIQSTEEWAQRNQEDWQQYWKGQAKIIHFIGGDIVYHHCLFWPAMLKGSGYNTPHAVAASGMVMVGGHVFSKSRGYVVWVDQDYLARGLDPDALRYYIASYTGHTRDLDFNWASYAEKLNKDLVGNIGNFIYRSLLFAHRNYKKIPEGSPEPGNVDPVKAAIHTIREGLDEYEFKKISDAVTGLASHGNRYLQAKEPWKLRETSPEEAADVVHNSLWLTKALAVLMEPLTPFKAEKVLQAFNLAPSPKIDEALEPLNPGQPLPRPEPLFRQLPEAETEALSEELTTRIHTAKG
jgi:methionyl-tRNA synthetase